jgi:hypothetical protein
VDRNWWNDEFNSLTVLQHHDVGTVVMICAMIPMPWPGRGAALRPGLRATIPVGASNHTAAFCRLVSRRSVFKTTV